MRNKLNTLGNFVLWFKAEMLWGEIFFCNSYLMEGSCGLWLTGQVIGVMGRWEGAMGKVLPTLVTCSGELFPWDAEPQAGRYTCRYQRVNARGDCQTASSLGLRFFFFKLSEWKTAISFIPGYCRWSYPDNSTWELLFHFLLNESQRSILLSFERNSELSWILILLLPNMHIWSKHGDDL